MNEQTPRLGGAPTLIDALHRLADAAPSATLFIEPVADGYREVTRGAFLTSVTALAEGLRAHGIGRGDCIATWLPNWSSAYAWQFAASALGAHVIGVNTRYNVGEVAHVLGKAHPKVLAMAHDFQRLDLLGRARDALAETAAGEVPLIVPVPKPGASLPDAADLEGYDLGGGVWVPAHDAARSGAASGAPSAGAGTAASSAEASPLAVAFTTSGSTGLPKLAAHRESGVIGHAVADSARIGFAPGDVLIGALPFSGVFGFSASMAAIFGGAAILLHPVFNEDELVQAMDRFRGTHFVGADDMVSRIAAAWERTRDGEAGPADLSSWAWMGIADFQGRSRELAAWAEREFGTVTVGVYGSSEIFALTAFWRADTDEARRWSGGGYPVSPAIGVRAADPFSGEVLATGVEGELQFRGPNVVDAYLGDTGEGAAAFTADGWFRTGDFGIVCEDGAFVYSSRMGDVLRLKGFLVHPSEIEFRLGAHPAVDTAKVVGYRGPDGETRAIAFVTLGPGMTADEAELQQWCRAELARYKVPSSVYVVDSMPTTAGTNGTKIRTAALREWARERQEAVAVGSAQHPHMEGI